MAFLESHCIRTVLSPSVLDCCNSFSCGNEDLNASIFTNYLPNARKKSIGRNLPWEKRYLIVDAYNQPVPLSFYEANGFKYMFSSERQECVYRNIDSTTKLHTRMMYFDLMLLSD